MNSEKKRNKVVCFLEIDLNVLFSFLKECYNFIFPSEISLTAFNYKINVTFWYNCCICLQCAMGTMKRDDLRPPPVLAVVLYAKFIRLSVISKHVYSLPVEGLIYHFHMLLFILITTVVRKILTIANVWHNLLVHLQFEM